MPGAAAERAHDTARHAAAAPTHKDRAIAKLVSFFVRLAYREVVVHDEPVPPGVPRVTVANHFGGFADALILLAVLPTRPGIVARDVIWNTPIVGRFMDWVGAIPVHKADDGGGGASNDQMFASCYRALDDGGHILIFPEGVTRNEPSIARVKTGASRIALGARADGVADVTIVPVGIHYENKAALRSRVFVNSGTPLSVDELLPAADHPAGADDRAAVDELTRAVDVGLRRAAPDYADWSEAHLLTDGADIALRDLSSDLAAPVPLALRDRLANALADRPDATRRSICEAVETYRNDLDALGVTDAALAPRLGSGRFAFRLAAQVVIAALLAPFAIAGAVINALPYLVVRAVGLLRVAPSMLSTLKPIVAVVAFGLTWSVVIWQAWSAIGWEGGIAAFVLMPVYFAAAVYFIERVTGAWQLLSRHRQHRSTSGLHDQLREERERVVEVVLTA